MCNIKDLKRVEQGQGSASEDDGVYPHAPGACDHKIGRTDPKTRLLKYLIDCWYNNVKQFRHDNNSKNI